MTQPIGDKSKWTFYHAEYRWGTLARILVKNQTWDRMILGHICPFIAGEVYPTESGGMDNPKAVHQVAVFGSAQPIDSSWPPLKDKSRTDWDVADYLIGNGHDCSTEAFSAATLLMHSGVYKSATKGLLEALSSNLVFVISVIGDPEVDAIYHSVVKPRLVARGFQPVRADEMHHAGLIVSAVTTAVSRSRFVVADLTRARPNCYYELGVAHALGKTGIIIARHGTERHFDVSGYRWNYWKPDRDFAPTFDAEIAGVVESHNQSTMPA